MTNLTSATVDPIERDRWGRPLVIPPGGGKPVPYTRCTTYVGVIEDTFNLAKWQQRMVALGLSSRPDLLLSVSAHRDDKQQLDKVCADAAEAAKAHAGATIGTALHSLTERLDRGLDVGVVPEDYRADLDAYTTATEDLTATHIEEFTVLDTFKIGGTPDRVVSYGGKRYIADLKTGSIDYGYLKIAAQLAVYSRSHLYHPDTGERTPHGAELDKGIVIHLPAGTGACRLYWVDLHLGWEAVKVARQVREKRSIPFKQVVTPFGPDTTTPAPVPAPELSPVPDTTPAPLSLADRITACTTPLAVRQLWGTHASEWTEHHTEIAKQHIAALQQ